jgi:D-hexose-6-phosphate mutarotase
VQTVSGEIDKMSAMVLSEAFESYWRIGRISFVSIELSETSFVSELFATAANLADPSKY